MREVHGTPDELLHTMKEEMNPRNAVASIDLMELERWEFKGLSWFYGIVAGFMGLYMVLGEGLSSSS